MQGFKRMLVFLLVCCNLFGLWAIYKQLAFNSAVRNAVQKLMIADVLIVDEIIILKDQIGTEI